MKRTWLQTVIALAVAGTSAGAGAQVATQNAAYPLNKPIRVVVPFTAGSATDIVARLVGPRMADRLGQQVVTDNRPSAGGIVACTIVAEATPDGHTLMVTGSNFAGSAALYSKLPFDAVKDFSGITQIASTPLVLVVNAGVGAKSVKELIALAREKPGQLNYASTGLGSGPHYAAELFLLRAGIKAVHVPYRGSPETLTDLMAGRVHFILSPVLAASPLVKSGKIVALGVTTTYRAAALPDVPTIQEAGLPTFEYQGWYGMLAPSKTPKTIINLLAREVAQIVEQADTRDRIAGLGAVAKTSSPQAFDKVVHDEIETRRKVWKAAGVKAE